VDLGRLGCGGRAPAFWGQLFSAVEEVWAGFPAWLFVVLEWAYAMARAGRGASCLFILPAPCSGSLSRACAGRAAGLEVASTGWVILAVLSSHSDFWLGAWFSGFRLIAGLAGLPQLAWQLFVTSREDDGYDSDEAGVQGRAVIRQLQRRIDHPRPWSIPLCVAVSRQLQRFNCRRTALDVPKRHM